MGSSRMHLAALTWATSAFFTRIDLGSCSLQLETGLLTMMLMKCTVKLRSKMECSTMLSSQEFLNTEPRRRMKFNERYSFLEETILINILYLTLLTNCSETYLFMIMTMYLVKNCKLNYLHQCE